MTASSWVGFSVLEVVGSFCDWYSSRGVRGTIPRLDAVAFVRDDGPMNEGKERRLFQDGWKLRSRG